MMNENQTGGGAVSRWVLATATVLAMALTGGSAQGADGTWTNLAGGTWGTAGNWAGGTVADGAGCVADFSTIDITGVRTITLDVNRAIGRLVFGDAGRTSGNAFGWILDKKNLTLDNTGGIDKPPAGANNYVVFVK